MPNIGATEILLILLVVLLLFGAKRLPDLSRSLGRSMRILKSETKALHDDAPQHRADDGREHADDAASADEPVPTRPRTTSGD